MNVTLSVETAGQRADQFLAARLDGLTRSAAQKLLEEGHVLCQGRPLKKNDRLKPGDQVAVCIPDPTPVELLPQDIPLEVVYEDEDVIVVNKPVGMVVHPAPGHPDGTLVNALLFHCGQSLSGINGQLRPGIVHRIDRDTSGLLIAAKNDGAHLALAQQLQDHSLYREYGFGQPAGGPGHHQPAHCPPPHGPEKDGGEPFQRPPRGDPLDGAGPLPGLHPCPVPAGDRTDPPDPGPHGGPGPSGVGGPGVQRPAEGVP